jgi:glycerol-1-phosphate dehydrogenase [NAD(P)+]
VSDAAIDRMLGELTAEGLGVPGKTQHVQVGAGIMGPAAAWIGARHVGEPDLVVCDAHTAAAAGEALLEVLRHRGRRATIMVLAPHDGEDDVMCDEPNIDALQARLQQEAINPIAVGAGTINDIVKMAASRLARPYQCVATAASMNGYTSAIAAVLSQGVKRTWPATPAEAVFADTEVIAAAPAYLNQAGFGDLLSKPYSNADWLLSHLVRDLPYAERPARLLDEAYEALLARAEAVRRGEPVGIGTLTRTILLSGFTMAIAGTSSPASGGEHLVSHYWDMEQHCREQPPLALHGTQVGIATRMSALLFERLLELSPKQIDPEAAAARLPDAGWIEALGSLHPGLTAPVVAEVREQLIAKQRHGDALRQELETVRSRWEEITARLDEVMVSARRVSQALLDAGAPDRPGLIGVGRDRAIRTLRVCRHIRSRYVALDLMDDLGLLDAWAPEVVDTCEATP